MFRAEPSRERTSQISFIMRCCARTCGEIRFTRLGTPARSSTDCVSCHTPECTPALLFVMDRDEGIRWRSSPSSANVGPSISAADVDPSTPLVCPDASSHQELVHVVVVLALSMCSMHMCLCLLTGKAVELLLRPILPRLSIASLIFALLFSVAIFYLKAELCEEMESSITSGPGAGATRTEHTGGRSARLLKLLLRYAGVRDFVPLPLVMELLLRPTYPELASAAPISALCLICLFMARHWRRRVWAWSWSRGDIVRSISYRVEVLDLVFLSLALFVYAVFSFNLGFTNEWLRFFANAIP